MGRWQRSRYMMGQHGQPLLPIYQVEPDAKKSPPQTKDVEWHSSGTDISNYADELFELVGAFRKTMVLSAACELEIFDEIHNCAGPVSTSQLCARKGWNEDHTERLLNSCVALKVLEKEVNKEKTALYSNTNASEALFRKAKLPTLWFYVMLAKKLVIPTELRMADAVRTGESQSEAATGMSPDQFTDPNSAFYNSFEKQMFFQSCMDAACAPYADILVRAFDLSDYKKTVDVGGGSGAIAFEMSRAYPEMSITLFDLPMVVKLKDRFWPKGETLNVEYVAGDMFKDDLPEADLYVLAHVIHNWDDDRIDTIMKKLYKALPPGGGILVLEKMMNDKKDGPFTAMELDMLEMCLFVGRERSGQEYKDLLTSHGFTDVQKRVREGPCQYDAILAKKPEATSA